MIAAAAQPFRFPFPRSPSGRRVVLIRGRILPGRSTAPRPWGTLGAVWCQVRRGIWPRGAVPLFRPRKILAAWLNGATVNTDRDLRPQYLAGLSLNIRDQHGIHAELTATRRFPDGLFIGSAANLAELRSAVENAEPGSYSGNPGQQQGW